MQPVHLSEIKSIEEYEQERPAWRPHILALKERRRIRVGDHLTFLFENRDTVRYQIQEMLRIEGITGPAQIQHEVETYNELIPAQGELCASLLIEYETPEQRAVKLRELLDLDRHIWIEAAGFRTLALFDQRQIATDRISAVQYIKFKLTAGQTSRWQEGAKIVVDHPYYHVERALAPAELDELASDFL